MRDAGTQRAARRSASLSRRLRLDIATPSGSRTVGTPTTSMPKSMSVAMRLMMASCW